MNGVDLLVLHGVDLKTRLRTDLSRVDYLRLARRRVVGYVAVLLLLLRVDYCLHDEPPLSLVGRSRQQLPLLLALVYQDLVLVLD